MRSFLLVLRPLFIAIIAFSTTCASAQRIQMIDIIGEVDSVSVEFEKKLGLSVQSKTDKSYVLKGKLGGEASSLELFFTPVSKKVYQGSVTKLSPIGKDTLQATFLKHVSKLVVRYTVPSYFVDSVGNKVTVTPAICSHVSGSKPVMNFPSGIKSVHWENMIYFSNLLLDTKIQGDKIVTDYRVINNLNKLESERALIPAAPKLDF